MFVGISTGETGRHSRERFYVVRPFTHRRMPPKNGSATEEPPDPPTSVNEVPQTRFKAGSPQWGTSRMPQSGSSFMSAMSRKWASVPGGEWPSAAVAPNAKALSRSKDLRSHVFGKRALGRTFWPPNPKRASSPVLALNRLATVKGWHGARPVVGDPLRRASLRLPIPTFPEP